MAKRTYTEEDRQFVLGLYARFQNISKVSKKSRIPRKTCESWIKSQAGQEYLATHENDPDLLKVSEPANRNEDDGGAADADSDEEVGRKLKRTVDLILKDIADPSEHSGVQLRAKVTAMAKLLEQWQLMRPAYSAAPPAREVRIVFGDPAATSLRDYAERLLALQNAEAKGLCAKCRGTIEATARPASPTYTNGGLAPGA